MDVPLLDAGDGAGGNTSKLRQLTAVEAAALAAHSQLSRDRAGAAHAPILRLICVSAKVTGFGLVQEASTSGVRRGRTGPRAPHAKAIGVVGGASAVLEAAGVSAGAPGVVIDDAGPALAALQELLAGHRVWERSPA
ncbi:MAG: hypothetical protein GX596_01660 [Propionibacterium sp.]|nr:hypothetical protein [Propionibacterium sp.]